MLVLAAAVLLGPACGGRPSLRSTVVDERAGREELLDLEQRMFEAIRNRDRRALLSILASDFELRVPGQAPLKRIDFINEVTSIPGTILAVQSDDVDARVFGEVGVITGTQRSAVRLDDGSTVTDTQAFTDVAVKRGGEWKMILAHSTRVGG